MINPTSIIQAISQSQRQSEAMGNMFVNLYTIGAPEDDPFGKTGKIRVRLWVMPLAIKPPTPIPTAQYQDFDTMADAQRSIPRIAEWFSPPPQERARLAEIWVDWASRPEWLPEALKAQAQQPRGAANVH